MRFSVLLCLWLLLPAVSGKPGNVCTNADCVPVFYAGLEGSKCYRIPSIIKTHKGTLLAFAENRHGNCGDNDDHDLVMRRSSDLGKSWGPMITVFKGIVPCHGCPKAVSNPNPVEVSLSNGTKAVLLVFDTMNNPSATRHGLNMRMWSYDDGLSWGPASVMSFPPQKNVGSLVGPATGLQASDGTLFFWITDGYLIVSRDRGVTWMATEKAKVGGECSIAFAEDDSNHTIIQNCRHSQNHRRSQLYWIPSGDAFVPTTPTYPQEFTDPGCQGSILNAGALFTSNAGSTSARAKLTIHRSDDQGYSWSDGLVLHAGPSAYSQLVGLPASLGVLFEAGATRSYETISFAAFHWHAPSPPPPPQQVWSHGADGTFSTDGKHCLDWTSNGEHRVYMSSCDPKHFPHHKWTLSSAGHVSTPGAGSLVLDWTSNLNPSGGHDVYMHDTSDSLPHQRWHYDGQTLKSDGGNGLCLSRVLPSGDVQMRPCEQSKSVIIV